MSDIHNPDLDAALTRKPGRLTSSMEAAAEKISQLEKSIAILIEHLGPVLRPETAGEGDKPPREPVPTSEMVQRVEAMEDLIDKASQEIMAIVDRVEL